jgi:hypothetical protein
MALLASGAVGRVGELAARNVEIINNMAYGFYRLFIPLKIKFVKSVKSVGKTKR